MEETMFIDRSADMLPCLFCRPVVNADSQGYSMIYVDYLESIRDNRATSCPSLCTV